MNLSALNYLLIFVQLSLFSCVDSPEHTNKSESDTITYAKSISVVNDLSLTIDSMVKITDEVGWVADYLDESYLIVTKDRQKVLIYQENDLKSITVSGEGPNNIRGVHKAGFVTKDKFTVADINSVVTYSLKGAIEDKCKNISSKINLGMDLKMQGIYNNEIILGCLNPLNEISSPSYFQNPDNFFLSKLNIETCNVTPLGKINSNSVYKDRYLPIRYRALWDMPLNMSSIAMIMPFDKIIDFYSIESNELIKSIQLSPEYFDEAIPVSGDDLSSKLQAMQINSSYIKIVLSDDGNSLLTYYQRGTDTPVDNLDYLNTNSTSFSRYIEIYRGGEKIGHDINVKDNLIPLRFISRNKILFYSTSFGEEEGVFFHYGTLTET